MEKTDERKEKFQKLIEEYKKEREREKKEHPEKFTPQWPYALFGVECRDGWKPLYQPLIDYVEKYNIGKKDEEKMEIHQIKEKFGGLRFYVNFYTDELREMIREAEEKSFTTCEMCGKHIDKPITENYWIYAECEDCHGKWLRERTRQLNEAYENKLKVKKMNSEGNTNKS